MNYQKEAAISAVLGICNKVGIQRKGRAKIKAGPEYQMF
jgi:hypothetical protein